MTIVSNGAGLDDAEQLANISYLDWGYGGSQPPLYTWITSLTTSVLGTSMLTLQIVKFGLLASLFLSVFGGMRLLGFSRIVSAASMLGLFLIPQIGWESQRALTHSVASTTGCGWTFLAFAWHMRTKNAISAAALGIAMAAAVLGKFNASFFLIMIIVTGLSVPQYRAVILSKLSAVTALVFIVCTGPTALWMLQHKSSVLARSSKLQIGISGNSILDRLTGVVSLAEAALLFSALALAMAGLIALFYHRQRTKPDTLFTPGETFMRRLLIIGLALILAGVVVSGATDVKDRWLQPILFLVPAVLAARLERYRAGTRSVLHYAIAGVVAALIVPPILSYNLVYGSNTPPYGQLDYRALYSEIGQHGHFNTILTDNAQIPGNFRLFDPSLRVIHPETPDPLKHISAPILVLWFGDATPNERIAGLLANANITPPQNGVITTKIAYKTRPADPLVVSYFLVK